MERRQRVAPAFILNNFLMKTAIPSNDLSRVQARCHAPGQMPTHAHVRRHADSSAHAWLSCTPPNDGPMSTELSPPP